LKLGTFEGLLKSNTFVYALTQNSPIKDVPIITTLLPAAVDAIQNKK